jgi:hypothetical protein
VDALEEIEWFWRVVISKARFGKETDSYEKTALSGLAEKNATMEGRETYSLIDNLINTPSRNNFRS